MFEQGTPLDWAFDPLEALARWPAARPVMLLHSGRFDGRWARWSVLAEPVGTYQFVGGEGIRGQGSGVSGTERSVWLGPTDACPATSFTHKPFHDLRSLLESCDGVFIGYLGYDMGRWVERLPTHARDDRGWPIVELAHCPGYAVYDGLTKRWHACGTWRSRYTGPDLTTRHGTQLPPDTRNPKPETRSAPRPLPRSMFTRPAYERAVAKVIDYIARGDVFQVNLAQRFSAEFHGKHPAAPRALFQRLAAVSPAWYGAYLELAASDAAPATRRAIASISPELFLQVETVGRERRVVTRPIKGTRPTSVDPNELVNSEKDTAELTMIVDLMRNDLGRVCDYGSVRVTSPRTIETHPTVHHGVATIEGRMHASKGIVDLLRAMMPGGSVTGAPKVRAMQIIDELEPVRRGPYCGAIGLLSRDAACLNVAIRTMMMELPAASGGVPPSGGGGVGRVDFSVGGGIVADSQPAAEYQETLDKAAAMLRALGVGERFNVGPLQGVR